MWASVLQARRARSDPTDRSGCSAPPRRRATGSRAGCTSSATREIPLRGSRIAESYLELMAHSAQAVQEHEVLLAVQADASRLRREDDGALERALLGACERIATGLERARRADRPARSRPGGLARALRVGYDPYVARAARGAARRRSQR